MTGASVPLADNNPSFTAPNLAEERAQHSINSSTRSCDTTVASVSKLWFRGNSGNLQLPSDTQHHSPFSYLEGTEPQGPRAQDWSEQQLAPPPRWLVIPGFTGITEAWSFSRNNWSHWDGTSHIPGKIRSNLHLSFATLLACYFGRPSPLLASSLMRHQTSVT